MSELAVYPGTFDPITNGHLDIIKRALNLFKSVIVLVVEHREKSPMFSVEERVRFVREATKTLNLFQGKRIEADSFNGLLVDYIKNKGAKVIIRGLRAVSDFDYEFQLTQLNRKLCPELETVFIMPDEEHFFLSSSMVKEIAYYGGDVSKFVPKIVAQALEKKSKA